MSDNVKNLAVVVAAAAILTALGWLVLHVVRTEWLKSEPPEVTALADATPTLDGEVPGADSTEVPPIDEAESEAVSTPEPEPVATDEPREEEAEASEADAEATLSPGDLHARLAPGTVTLEAVGGDAGRRRIGAGFVVAPGVVATTRAVAERAETIEARGLDVAGASPVERTLRIDRDLGLALLVVPDLAAPALEADAIEDVADGTRVYALADAEVVTGFAEGLVDSIRMLGRTRALTMSVGVPPHLEGGPVADAAGRVIGIAARRPVEGSVEEVVISAAAVRALVEGGGSEPARPVRRAPPTERPARTTLPEPTEPEPAVEPEPVEPTPAIEPEPPQEREPEEDPQPLPTRPPRPPRSFEDGSSRAPTEERRIAPRDLVLDSSAKLHEEPDPSSHVIARLRAGTVVTAIAERGEWWRIRSSSGRRDGYLLRSLTRSRSRAR